jgi:hypothetical protein
VTARLCKERISALQPVSTSAKDQAHFSKFAAVAAVMILHCCCKKSISAKTFHRRGAKSAEKSRNI